MATAVVNTARSQCVVDMSKRPAQHRTPTQLPAWVPAECPEMIARMRHIDGGRMVRRQDTLPSIGSSLLVTNDGCSHGHRVRLNEERNNGQS